MRYLSDDLARRIVPTLPEGLLKATELKEENDSSLLYSAKKSISKLQTSFDFIGAVHT